jgi:hypothetical protein
MQILQFVLFVLQGVALLYYECISMTMCALV